jgi:hypothetical protein
VSGFSCPTTRDARPRSGADLGFTLPLGTASQAPRHLLGIRNRGERAQRDQLERRSTSVYTRDEITTEKDTTRSVRIHRATEKKCSRKLNFRCGEFSEAQQAKKERGIWKASCRRLPILLFILNVFVIVFGGGGRRGGMLGAGVPILGTD